MTMHLGNQLKVCLFSAADAFRCGQFMLKKNLRFALTTIASNGSTLLPRLFGGNKLPQRQFIPSSDNSYNNNNDNNCDLNQSFAARGSKRLPQDLQNAAFMISQNCR